jgi:two-component system, NarL family, invasion response regulator UvrY
MTKVLLIDDHDLVRAGLKHLLDFSLGKIFVGEARNADEALALVAQQSWDIAITDITLPGRSGLDILGDFRTLRPKMPVLVISALPEDEIALRVLKSGAAGFAHKESSGQNLIDAIRKVLAGGKYVSPALAEKLAAHMTAPPVEDPHKKLSNREYLVMTMLAAGKTLTEIGKILSLSIKTISTYRSRILQKMHLDNNSELTRYALKHGLVD